MVCFCVCMRESYTERKREWEGCIMENDCFQQICRREDSSLHREKKKKNNGVSLGVEIAIHQSRFKTLRPVMTVR